jgi:aminodeoxyfutalosine deaminase
MLQGWDPSWTVRRIDAAAAIDGAGASLAHASGVSAVIERTQGGALTLAALGPTGEVAQSSRWTGVPTTDRRAHLLIPGLVNAHTHLDLTHIGPRPHHPADGFADWINMIRRERLADELRIAASVAQGVNLSLTGATALVGDIAGAVGGKPSPFAAKALADTGRINGTTFLEFFARGPAAHKAVDSALFHVRRLTEDLAGLPGPRTVPGIQPHAPYSVAEEWYEVVLNALPPGTPACTHLAESQAEHLFTAEGRGPFADLLRTLGLLDPTEVLPAGGQTPIERLAVVMNVIGSNQGVLSAVHVNDASDSDLTDLEDAGWPVIYCPRASAYFAAERDFGPHRYRDMLDRGITVALGTDSIVNLDTPDRISVWDEMRLLHRRDGTDPVTLLAMATVNGAEALRRDPKPFTLKPGGVGGEGRGGGVSTLAGLAAIPIKEANPGADPSELLRLALTGSGGEGTAGAVPELLAIGRV